MPIIKSAQKALRQTKKRTIVNKRVKDNLKKAVKTLTEGEKSPEQLKQVYKAADLAVKKNLIHANKAARLKSRLAKQVSLEPSPSPAKTIKKKQTPKSKA